MVGESTVVYRRLLDGWGRPDQPKQALPMKPRPRPAQGKPLAVQKPGMTKVACPGRVFNIPRTGKQHDLKTTHLADRSVTAVQGWVDGLRKS